jgi:cysteate synthase
MGEYSVRCVSDGSEQPAYALSCPEHNSLLRAYYRSRRLETRDLPGMWKFLDWLPVKGIIERTGEGSVTYKSHGLAAELGLKNLYISFSGYWPERGARMPTCSFKDLEAPPTVKRLQERGDRPILVVASAGNTARAFAQTASIAGQKLVLFVPENALHRMWITVEAGPVTLISVKGDYFDAIQVADKVQSLPGFVPEGGARNIARRDGMGTVMLEAALTIGKIPQHYFQAVGSGTGGISAWEAGMRLIEDGRFGSELSCLHLAQNIPNAPIYYAWTGKEPEPFAAEMFDDVLFNRRPPYGVTGGVKDALEATGGQVYGISDQKAASAKRLFEESEEIDILNAPAIAVAALEQAAKSGAVLPEDIILLNITGGGVARLREEMSLNTLSCDATVSEAQEAVQFLEGRI